MNGVHFEGRWYELKPGETVLEALIRGGATLRFSCKKGSCHTCVMSLEQGSVNNEAREGLREDLVKAKFFLPCRAHTDGELRVARPRKDKLYHTAKLESVEALGTVRKVLLEPESVMQWRGGQAVKLLAPDGSTKHYPVASTVGDYFLELYVDARSEHPVDRWLSQGVQQGEPVSLQGPYGGLLLDENATAGKLVLASTGVGVASTLGLLRELVQRAPRGKVRVLAEDVPGVTDVLAALVAEHADLSFWHGSGDQWVAALGETQTDLEGWTVYAWGEREAVQALRVEALRLGVARSALKTQHFETVGLREPRDQSVLDGMGKEPALWQAVGEREGLVEMLEDFYTRVYADPRLGPFFHRVTKQRAVEKQFEFLRWIFTGEGFYFGLKPFNAHHWMVISEELFDYREALFDKVLEERGVPLQLRWRWSALHERFRLELLKDEPRGLRVDGIEVEHPAWSEEEMVIGALCDGCQSELPVGSRARVMGRTGQLFCSACTSRNDRPLGL